MAQAAGTPAHRAARRLTILTVGLLAFLGACRNDVFAPRTGVITVYVTGTPPDPGIVTTVYIRDHIPPHNEARAQVAIGDSTVFTGLGDAGFRIDVGIENLETHDCTVVATTAVVRFEGLRVVTVETNPNFPPEVVFELSCRSATLEIETSGLLPGDSADVFLAAGDSAEAFDAYTDGTRVRVGNGSRSVSLVPDPSQWVIPAPVLAPGPDRGGRPQRQRRSRAGVRWRRRRDRPWRSLRRPRASVLGRGVAVCAGVRQRRSTSPRRCVDRRT